MSQSMKETAVLQCLISGQQMEWAQTSDSFYVIYEDGARAHVQADPARETTEIQEMRTSEKIFKFHKHG